jgi:hypothetical protein
MKFTCILALALLTFADVSAQTDSTKVEQYCQVIASPVLLSNKITITLDFGNEKSFWRDGRLKTDGGKIKRFNTVIDALNYMGREGWIFMNAYPVRTGDTEIYHFAFKKLFSRSDIDD